MHTSLFGLAAILHRSGFCFHLFKWYAREPVLTGLRDPPVCSCVKREKHAPLNQTLTKSKELGNQLLAIIGVRAWESSIGNVYLPSLILASLNTTKEGTTKKQRRCGF